MDDSWKRWEELLNAPIPPTIINEPIDFSVNFVVKETATERARRIWRMEASDA
jgi:hypothetical protein